ncbi:hypothetical protein CspeluHIS016_0701690 [Cutaneotrichosporon spelunceum]|uniref:Peroxisomal membrane protein PEX16 n=1 Tax=Cutaneotrichosporon spelunceum TaxID=1672016 RepID=A0AAD3YEL6_9TREE|nr:hypothetical protein CspeluHIS016_0701690 [Cutaneotrichosporon spelunceum]
MSNLVQAYEQLLIDNVSTVNTVESAIRNVTWFLPGRFADADIASEGLYSLLSVVSSVHDTLLEKRIPAALSLPPHPFAPEAAGGPSTVRQPGFPPVPRLSPILPAPSEHARYTRYWSEQSKTYRRASRALTTITYIELLSEMVAKRRAGDRIRWKVVLSIESIKTILRLLIIAITRRPVLDPPTPRREFDFASVPQDKLLPRSSAGANKNGDSERRAVLGAVATRAPLRNHLFPLIGSLPEEYLAHPLMLVPELGTGSEMAGELLSATAILVQVVLLIRAFRSPNRARYHPASLPTLSRNLWPFAVPMAMQLLARRLRMHVGDSTLLAEHYSHADRRIASHFFLQGPMWIGWTRPKVVGVINFLGRIPLISLAGDLIGGYLPLVDDYFYMVT